MYMQYAFCGLFNDAVSIHTLACIASDNRMIDEWTGKGNKRKNSRPNRGGICGEEQRKTAKTISQDGLCPGRDSNRAPPERKSSL
jgi:hypothetical protein